MCKVDTSYQVISLAKSNLKENKIVFVSKEDTIFLGNDRNLGYRDIIKLKENKDLQYAKQLKDSYCRFIENTLYAIEKRNGLFYHSLK